jgi:hypothetical protein
MSELAPATPPMSCRSYDRHQAEEADGDEGALHDTSCDVAEGERFVLPLEDREQRDRGADVGDDKDHLEERPEGDAGVGARADDVAGVVEDRVIQDQPRWDRGDEGDEEEHARDSCDRLMIHLRFPP